MTLEQEIDYKALGLISKNKTYSNSDLVTLFSNILTPSKAAELHKKFVENEYYKQSVSGIPDYVLHDRAIFYLDFLNKEKDKDDLDFKLKQISYDNVKWNKNFPMYALCVAILAIGVPLIIKSCDQNKVVTYKLDTQQLQLLIKAQTDPIKPPQVSPPYQDGDDSVSQ